MKANILTSVKFVRLILCLFCLTPKGPSKKDIENLHLDYSLNYVTAVLHNVTVALMFDSSEFFF